MAQVIWTNRAIRELNEVVEHIEKEDMKIAREIAAEAFRAADDRLLFPDSGSMVPELDSPHIREVLIRRTFRLLYKVENEDIFVLAFVRSTKQLGRTFLKNL